MSESPPKRVINTDALAEGRERMRVVRAYLLALPSTPTRKRRDPQELRAEVERVERERADALGDKDVIGALKLSQKLVDLRTQLSQMEALNLPELEAEFVRVAQRYSEAQGISYAAWRDMGVPAEVLKRAGIKE